MYHIGKEAISHVKIGKRALGKEKILVVSCAFLHVGARHTYGYMLVCGTSNLIGWYVHATYILHATMYLVVYRNID